MNKPGRLAKTAAKAVTPQPKAVTPPLPPHAQPQQLRVQQYSGKVPPPEMLGDFDRIVPGMAQRLLKLAEDESHHRREIESRTLAANIRAEERRHDLAEYQAKSWARMSTAGQAIGFIVCAGCIVGAVVLAINGQPWVAGIIASVPTAAIIKAFFTQQKK